MKKIDRHSLLSILSFVSKFKLDYISIKMRTVVVDLSNLYNSILSADLIFH